MNQNTGNIYIVAIIGLMVAAGAVAVDGLPNQQAPSNAEVVKIVVPKSDPSHTNLQLKTFGYVTLAPTPASVGQLCQSGGVNNEPQILVYPNANTPSLVIPSGGQVKVWVNDEGAPFISSGEQVNLTTGQVITHGDTTQKAADNFLYEPALYIAPATAETGGTPHFPTAVKGQFNNDPPNKGPGIKGAPMDGIPAGGGELDQNYTAEFIWDVSSLGLAAGNYQAEFVIHDGDRDRGVGCVALQIQ